MKLVVLACLFAAALAAPELNVFLKGWKHVGEWEEFKKTYQKSYSTTEEELKRFQIFADHSEKVEKHNAEEAQDGRHGFKTGINEYADLSTEEFVKMFNNFKPKPKSGNAITYLEPDNLQMPETVDWRQKGYVTGVKNQGQCGSCWSFSTTGSLEGQHFKKTGELVSLSEQNLVDCSTNYGNQGCAGGLMDQAFEYIKANGGIDTEASYPYTARDGTCQFNPANVGATVTGYVDIPAQDEVSLQSAVASAGPVSVAIDASHWSFQMYKSGVYNEGACSQTALDHGVLAVGYGTDNGNAYWLVKNSWGTTWGMEGYIMMSRNADNQCGIATMASYPTV